MQKIIIYLTLSIGFIGEIYSGTYPYSFVENINQADDYLKTFMQQKGIVEINNYETKQGFIRFKDGRTQTIGCNLPLQVKVTLQNGQYHYQTYIYSKTQKEYKDGLKGHLIKCVINSI